MNTARPALSRRTLALVLGFAALAAGLAGARAYARSAVPFPASLSWYNVSRPLTLDDLRGRAVLLDFFTPGCINCIHMLPAEQVLELEFGKRLVVIGIDSPDDSAASRPDGLKAFIQRYGLTHPFVLDANLTQWKAYGVQVWPTLVLLGPDGNVLQQFVGEQSLPQLAGPITAALRNAPSIASLKPLPLQPMALSHGLLGTPAGIAVSPTLVAISDTGHNRVILADHEGVVQAVVGTGCIGDADGSFDSASFYRPHGLAFHDGTLYVADTQNQLLRSIDLATHTVGTVAGVHERGYIASGTFAAASAVLDSPWDLAWYGGEMYVSMAGDHQIWRYDPATGQIGPWAGNGREGLHDGSRTNAEFAQPSGLSLEGSTLYDVDPESHSVRAIDMHDGSVTTLIGSRDGDFNYGMQNGFASRALLQHDEGIVADGDHLYIADTFNNALRGLDLHTQRVTTVAAALQRPIAVALLDPHTVLVAEGTGNRIVAVSVPDGQVSPWPLTGLKPPNPAACNAP